MSNSHKEYTKAEDIPAILALLEENSEWLYNDGQNSTRGAYTERIDKINSKILPIKQRYDNFHQILEEINNLFGCLDANFHFLNSLETKYAHITPEERQESLNFIERCRSWISNVQEKQGAKHKWEDAATSVKELRDKAREVNENVKKTMSKPVPKPA